MRLDLKCFLVSYPLEWTDGPTTQRIWFIRAATYYHVALSLSHGIDSALTFVQIYAEWLPLSSRQTAVVFKNKYGAKPCHCLKPTAYDVLGGLIEMLNFLQGLCGMSACGLAGSFGGLSWTHVAKACRHFHRQRRSAEDMICKGRRSWM